MHSIFYLFIIILLSACNKNVFIKPIKAKSFEEKKKSFYLSGSTNYNDLLKNGFVIHDKEIHSSSRHTVYKVTEKSLLSQDENKKHERELSLKELWYEKTHDLYDISKGNENKESYLAPSQISSKELVANPYFKDLKFNFEKYNLPSSIEIDLKK